MSILKEAFEQARLEEFELSHSQPITKERQLTPGWSDILEFSKSRNITYRAIAVILNSAITQQRKVFKLSRESVRDLLSIKLQSRRKDRGISNEEYTMLRKAIRNLKTVFKIHDGIVDQRGNTILIVELVHDLFLGLISKKDAITQLDAIKAHYARELPKKQAPQPTPPQPTKKTQKEDFKQLPEVKNDKFISNHNLAKKIWLNAFEQAYPALKGDKLKEFIPGVDGLQVYKFVNLVQEVMKKEGLIYFGENYMDTDTQYFTDVLDPVLARRFTPGQAPAFQFEGQICQEIRNKLISYYVEKHTVGFIVKPSIPKAFENVEFETPEDDHDFLAELDITSENQPEHFN